MREIPRPRTLLGYAMVGAFVLMVALLAVGVLVHLFGPDRPWCLLESAWQFATTGSPGSCA